MRCKGCDYPLWDIAARACPECGLPFRPSDYEFAINSVRFCCPHCQQPYYGTGDRGHLVPPRFHCVSCARLVDVDEMIVLPREGVPESISIPDRMPWLERHRIGFWKAVGGTWVRALGAPTRLAESIPLRSPDGSGGPTVAPAFGYAMLFTIPYLLVGSSFLLIPMALGAAAGAGGRGLSAVLGVASVFASVAIGAMLFFFMWAMLAHVTLRLSGSTPAGFAGTVSALGYSSSVNFLSAIPCIGFMTVPLGVCWWGVVATLMVMRIQRATPIRAVSAFIIAPVLAATIVGVGGGYSAYSLASRFPRVPAPGAPVIAPPVATAPLAPRTLFGLADRIGGACLDYRTREGSWPRTCLDLVRGGDISASHLIYSGSTSTARAGEMTLDDVDLLVSENLRRLADAAANERDHASGISRAGQVYMFTGGLDGDHGLDAVWIAVVVSRNPEGEVCVVHADGTAISERLDQDVLDAQNMLRQLNNLPPLPPLEDWP